MFGLFGKSDKTLQAEYLEDATTEYIAGGLSTSKYLLFSLLEAKKFKIGIFDISGTRKYLQHIDAIIAGMAASEVDECYLGRDSEDLEYWVIIKDGKCELINRE